MIKEAFQTFCLLVLASVLYDVLRCNRIHKTLTYKFIRHFGSSKTGRLFLKKLKRARRRFLRNAVWPSYTTAMADQLEPYFLYSWPEIKSSAVAVFQEVRWFLGKNFPALESFVSLLSEDLLNLARAGVLEVSQQVQRYAKKALECLAKAIL